ncbi:MAG TPA: hypothetical protein VEF04_15435 [Blastocatellia bacterium]|nr:hypothetical protein [Blastocatellia bacterium]
MADPVSQLVTIKVVDGRVEVTPPVRDLYLGEEVEWFCTEPDWEVNFQDQRPGTEVTPFVSETFGPGIVDPIDRATRQQLASESLDEFPKYLTGETRATARDGQVYPYQARVGSFSPRTARVRFFRRVRPNPR